MRRFNGLASNLACSIQEAIDDARDMQVARRAIALLNASGAVTYTYAAAVVALWEESDGADGIDPDELLKCGRRYCLA